MKCSKYTRAAALMLIIVMLSALILSCADSNSSETISDTSAPDENVSQENQQDTTEEEGMFIKPNYDLPVQDFDGYNFRVISRSYASNSHWYNLDIAVEAEMGDPINDAVYLRNKTIEEKYNITITNFPSESVSATVSKTVKAGDDAYDAVVTGITGGMEGIVTQGMLYDLKSLPYVDLSQPWWDKLAAEQLSINDKLFATSSDLTIRDKDATIILTFSKKLVKDFGLEDLYQLVLSGKWTFDKMLEMMKAVTKDLNGDGVINDEDQIGLLTQLRHSFALFNGTGEYIAQLDDEKLPHITLYSERAVEICERIKEIQGDKNLTLNADEYGSKYTDVWDGLQIPMFSENRALFYHAGMNRVTLLRDMEADFGIIPPPKYNEQQERYHVWVDPWCTSAVSVPITVADPERTGLILEALTYESRYTLLPAYYDINLKTKFFRDDESKEMLDIILDNRSYDIGDIYAWGSAGTLFTNLAKGTDSLSTFYDKNSMRFETAMNKTIEKFDTIE